MKNMSGRTAIALGIITLVALLGGCSSNDTNSVSEPPAASVVVTESANIIDVRSDAEYAAGHLEGATQFDLSNGELEEALGTLDKNAEYFVYCRSGNRSAQATALMEQAGFTKVTDLGSMENAAELTGIKIVQD
jgi:hypothetical protein